MEFERIFDGHYNYVVIPVSKKWHSTQKSVYHVLTDNPKWCADHLPMIVGYSKIESKGLHDLNYKRNPTMENALKPYYSVEVKEDKRYIGQKDLNSDSFPIDPSFYYEFTYVRPYDD